MNAKNTRRKEVPDWLMEGLGDVVVLQNPDEFEEQYAKRPLVMDVRVNEYLRDMHIRPEEVESPTKKIEQGMVAHPLLLDPAYAPGELLRPGDYVNVTGEFDFGRLGRKFYTIIRSVQVLTVGGRSADTATSAGSFERDEGVRSFRSITIEVSPEVSLKLFDLTERMTSPTVRVQTLSRQVAEGFERPDDPQIDPKLEKLAVAHGLLSQPGSPNP
jgi:hypothetical protein